MNKYQIMEWNVINRVDSQKFFVEALHDDYEGFRIILKGENPQDRLLKVSFEDALTYKNTDESYMLKIWHSNKKEILGKTFYRRENSDYIDYFHEMTQGLYADWNIIHYAIYTDVDCIDVLSQSEPIVKWLD